MAAAESARLNELDRDEFFELARVLRPDLTRDEFESDWVEFQREKQRRRAH